MNYYSHHIKDYMMATAHLNEREDLFYRRLRDIYMFMEGRLPVVASEVARLVRAKTNAARAAVTAVLHSYFAWDDTRGWHLPELDGQIANITRRARATATEQPMGAVVDTAPVRVAVPVPTYLPTATKTSGPSGDATRAKRSRLKRSAMFRALQELGHAPAGLDKGDDLAKVINSLPNRADIWRDIYSKVDAQMAEYVAKRTAPAVVSAIPVVAVVTDVTPDVTPKTSHVTASKETQEPNNSVGRDVTADGDVAAHAVESLAVTAKEVRDALGAMQAPLGGMLSIVASKSTPDAAALDPYQAAAAAMRGAGCIDAAQGDVKLRRLVDVGVSREVLIEAAGAAAARGHGLAWALGRVEGKLKDAAVATGGGTVGANTANARPTPQTNSYLERLRAEEQAMAALSESERDALAQHKKAVRDEVLARFRAGRKASALCTEEAA